MGTSDNCPLNSASVVILFSYCKQIISYDRAKLKRVGNFLQLLVDFCRPDHILRNSYARKFMKLINLSTNIIVIATIAQARPNTPTHPDSSYLLTYV